MLTRQPTCDRLTAQGARQLVTVCLQVGNNVELPGFRKRDRGLDLINREAPFRAPDSGLPKALIHEHPRNVADGVLLLKKHLVRNDPNVWFVRLLALIAACFEERTFDGGPVRPLAFTAGF